MKTVQLVAKLQKAFPVNATKWSQATDEIRDMSRWAREELEIDEDAALNFRAIRTPAEWNAKGIESIANFYDAMNDRQRSRFVSRWELVLNA